MKDWAMVLIYWVILKDSSYPYYVQVKWVWWRTPDLNINLGVETYVLHSFPHLISNLLEWLKCNFNEIQMKLKKKIIIKQKSNFNSWCTPPLILCVLPKCEEWTLQVVKTKHFETKLNIGSTQILLNIIQTCCYVYFSSKHNIFFNRDYKNMGKNVHKKYEK